VHYTRRGKTDDPDIKSALGRLLTGGGPNCVEDAAAVILAYEPTVLPQATRQAPGVAWTRGALGVRTALTKAAFASNRGDVGPQLLTFC
jgi:hypothetical protein